MLLDTYISLCHKVGISIGDVRDVNERCRCEMDSEASMQKVFTLTDESPGSCELKRVLVVTDVSLS